jgi:protein-S-isoprenylcysteine O-methyltransferase Ste14
VPKSIDSEPRADWIQPFLVDAGLLALFAVQHSLMARVGFKRWWTQFIPRPIERSTYVLVSSLLLAILFWLWQPVLEVIWATDLAVLKILSQAIFWMGWGIVLWSTFLIDHFDLFGLNQVYQYFRGRPYTPPDLKAPALYRFVRHPIMLGFLLAFWATSRMTAGHLLFAGMTTLYVLVAIRLEERDLIRFYGQEYENYRTQACMLLPRLVSRKTRRNRETNSP